MLKPNTKFQSKCVRRIVFFVLFFYLFAGGFYLLNRVENSKSQETKVHMEDTGEFSDVSSIRTFYLDDSCYTTEDEVETYLFLGTDEKAGKSEQKNMADFLLVLVFNRSQNTYGFIQIDRNTMTDVPILEEGQILGDDDVNYLVEQICTAYWYGEDREQSCELVADAVSGLLGEVNVDGYYAFGMDDICKMNAFVGGVEVTLRDDFSMFDSEMQVGKRLLLSDEQAFIFLHSRMEVADGTNKNRMLRQEEYLNGFLSNLQKKYKEDYENEPQKFILESQEVLSNFSVEPESNQPFGVWAALGRDLSKASNLGIFHFEGETKLGQQLGDGVLHEECYIAEASKAEVLSKLYHLKSK